MDENLAYFNANFFQNIAESSGTGLKYERIKLVGHILADGNGIHDLANEVVIIFKGSDEEQKEVVANFLERNLFDKRLLQLCKAIQCHPEFKAMTREIKPDSLAATLIGIAG